MLRRRIVYLVALVVALVAFVGTNEPLALGAVAVLVVLFAGSALACVAAASFTRLAFDVLPACEVGGNLPLVIEVRRSTVVLLGCIECRVSARNLLMDQSRTVPVELGATGGARARFELPLDTQMCGRVELVVDEAFACDPLGLLRRRIPCSYTGSYAVYPHVIDLAVPLERSPQAAFSGMAYDPRKHGQDMSEPFDIRDYRVTDPLRTIHWKLSSKFDRLLVREASHPSNYDVLLLADAACVDLEGAAVSTSVLTAVLDLTASISFELCRQGLGHNVAFAEQGRLSDTMVDSSASFDEMLDLMVGTPLPHTPAVDAVLFEAYRRERSFTKTVLVTCFADQRLFEELGRTTDLSVVHVAAAGGKAVEETAAFALTSVPAEDVAAHVKSVAI